MVAPLIEHEFARGRFNFARLAGQYGVSRQRVSQIYWRWVRRNAPPGREWEWIAFFHHAALLRDHWERWDIETLEWWLARYRELFAALAADTTRTRREEA